MTVLNSNGSRNSNQYWAVIDEAVKIIGLVTAHSDAEAGDNTTEDEDRI